jgi:hypothetical protein
VSRFAHEHRIRLGQGLQAGREVHRVSEDRYRCVSPLLHLPDHRRPGVQTDPQLWFHAVFAFEVRSASLQPLQDRQRRPASPQRCILKCNRRTKDCHDAVAGKALHDAALLAHSLIHKLGQAPHQRKCRFLARAL